MLEPRDWTAEQRQFLQAHFAKEILPVLTPLAVQELDPPPRLPGLQWYVAAVLASARVGGADRRHAGAQPVFPLDPPAGQGGRLPGAAGGRDRRQRCGRLPRLRRSWPRPCSASPATPT